jgi:hypothetical protein
MFGDRANGSYHLAVTIECDLHYNFPEDPYAA